MGQILDRDVARQVTALGKVLLKDADELAAEMADRIQAAVPIYRRADIVTTEQFARPAWLTLRSSSPSSAARRPPHRRGHTTTGAPAPARGYR